MVGGGRRNGPYMLEMLKEDHSYKEVIWVQTIFRDAYLGK